MRQLISFFLMLIFSFSILGQTQFHHVISPTTELPISRNYNEITNQTNYSYSIWHYGYRTTIINNNPPQYEHEIYHTAYKFNFNSIPDDAYNLTFYIEAYRSSGTGNSDLVSTSNNLNFNNLEECWNSVDVGNKYFTVDLNPGIERDFTAYISPIYSQGYINLGIRESNLVLNQYGKVIIRLHVYYNLPLAIIAKNNFIYGTIKVGIDSPATQRNSPFPFSANVGQTVNLEAENQSYGGYERVWNNYAPNSPSDWWRNGAFFSNQTAINFTVSQNDDNATYQDNLRKNYAISRNDNFTEFDGTVSAGVITHIVEQNTGQISAPIQQTINGKNYKYIWWTDNYSSTNPRTIAPDDNQTYTALYKYPHHSNQTNAYINPGQRRFVQTPDGVKHICYESMGKVWYELSTNGGSTWIIGNGGKPLSTAASKNPSMSFYGNQLGIVWQEQYSTTFKINIAVFYNNYYSSSVFGTVAEEVLSYSIDANPVLAFGYSISGQGNLMVAWSGGLYHPFYSQAIMLRLGFATSNGISWTTNNYLYGTDANSINPSLAANYLVYTNPVNYHLAYEQKVSSTSSKIKYCKTYYQSGNIYNSTIEEPSYNSGYSKNYSPLVALRKIGNYEYVYVTWLGYRESQEEESLQKGNALLPGETRVLMKNKYTSWSVLGVYGNNVNNFNLNKGTTILSNMEIMGLCWSETNGSSCTNKAIKSPGTGYINTLSTTGKDLQINNSVNFSDMFVNSFQSLSSPYSFNLSQNFNTLSKENTLSIFSGREGVVGNNEGQFFFALGDVIADGQDIEFVPTPDSLLINSLTMLNGYFETEPFDVNSNSSLTYGVQYGITDSLACTNTLSGDKQISFRVQLIDAATNQLLGLFDEVTYNSENVFQYNNIGYQVDMNGIGQRSIKLRLVIDTNADFGYSLSNRLSDQSVLAKNLNQKVNYQGSLTPVEYSLEQNYPNPFNPATIIRYQIPSDGLVTLRIYDILGREITTLVNEEKATGRYEVSFDASNLASGVYIYELRVNDFVNTKKMMLLK